MKKEEPSVTTNNLGREAQIERVMTWIKEMIADAYYAGFDDATCGLLYEDGWDVYKQEIEFDA